LRAFFYLLSGVGAKHHTQNIGGLFVRKCEDSAVEIDGHITHLSPFNRLLKGSVSAAVIERAHCPVLVDVRAQ